MTRRQQVDEVLRLLEPPAEQRERCRETIGWALDKMKAHVEPNNVTSKAKRRWSSAMKRIQAEHIAYAAAGGDPWELPRDVMDRAIQINRFSEIGIGLPPWSRKQRAIVLAHDLLSEWNPKRITISRQGKWCGIAQVLHNDKRTLDLYRQLRQSLPDIRYRLEICGPCRVRPA
jgi:hypothetical protein